MKHHKATRNSDKSDRRTSIIILTVSALLLLLCLLLQSQGMSFWISRISSRLIFENLPGTQRFKSTTVLAPSAEHIFKQSIDMASSRSEQSDQQVPEDLQQPSTGQLALPAPDDVADVTHKLDINNPDGIKLDHLGPMVVNVDGSISRISNWDQMTDIEKRNTQRVLSKRNGERLQRLQQATGEQK